MESTSKQVDTVAQFQNAFSETYPFLKIEFFEPDEGILNTRKRKVVAPETSLKKIKKAQADASIIFGDNTTVFQLEKSLKEEFGLVAQVYRRAGNIWIETNITDMWTLAHQNEQGRQLSIKDGIGVNGLHRNTN